MSQEPKLGDILHEARKRKGWSQSELARRIGIEASSGFITKIEKNRALPSYENLYSLANVLALDHEQLFALAEAAKAQQAARRIEAKGASVRRAFGRKGYGQKSAPADQGHEEGSELEEEEELVQAVLADEDLRRAVRLARTALANPNLKPEVFSTLEMFARLAIKS
jgi:transcriptional regulator with XRE-family HTH domain